MFILSYLKRSTESNFYSKKDISKTVCFTFHSRLSDVLLVPWIWGFCSIGAIIFALEWTVSLEIVWSAFFPPCFWPFIGLFLVYVRCLRSIIPRIVLRTSQSYHRSISEPVICTGWMRKAGVGKHVCYRVTRGLEPKENNKEIESCQKKLRCLLSLERSL